MTFNLPTSHWPSFVIQSVIRTEVNKLWLPTISSVPQTLVALSFHSHEIRSSLGSSGRTYLSPKSTSFFPAKRTNPTVLSPILCLVGQPESWVRTLLELFLPKRKNHSCSLLRSIYILPNSMKLFFFITHRRFLLSYCGIFHLVKLHGGLYPTRLSYIRDQVMKFCCSWCEMSWF